jgi:hypothetical protein
MGGLGRQYGIDGPLTHAPYKETIVKTLQGRAIFLAQFADDKPPFDNLDNRCKWAAGFGCKGVQIHTWATSLIDIDKAATSKTYADELKGTATKHGVKSLGIGQ